MKIHAIQTGTVLVKRSQRIGQGKGLMRMMNVLRDSQWTKPLPIYTWLLEHPEGLILVDTGETARTAEPGYFPSWHPYYRRAVVMDVQPEDEVGPRLRHLGFSTSDVRWVVMTHLHTDHAGGLQHFPKSEILVAPEEYRRASGRLGQLRGYLPNRWPKWFSPVPLELQPNPFGPFQKSLRFTEAGDVVIVPTPGHTPHHVSVVVQDEECRFFLAGDTSYTEEALRLGLTDGVAPNEREAYLTLERIGRFIEEMPTVYLPSHDPSAEARLSSEQKAVPISTKSAAAVVAPDASSSL